MNADTKVMLSYFKDAFSEHSHSHARRTYSGCNKAFNYFACIANYRFQKLSLSEERSSSIKAFTVKILNKYGTAYIYASDGLRVESRRPTTGTG